LDFILQLWFCYSLFTATLLSIDLIYVKFVRNMYNVMYHHRVCTVGLKNGVDQATVWTIRSSVPGSSKRFFSSQKLSHRLWGSAQLLFYGCGLSSPKG